MPTRIWEQVESPDWLVEKAPEPEPAEDGSVDVAGFQGTLEDIGLPSLFYILEMERSTGILFISVGPDQGKARLDVSEGRILRAHLDRVEEPCNAELVYGLIPCSHGTFDFQPSRVIPDDEILCPTTKLVLEGIRRMNEAPPALPLDSVPDGPREDGVSPEAQRTSDLDGPDEVLPVPRRVPPKRVRRMPSAKASVAALGTAIFLLAVITAVLCSG